MSRLSDPAVGLDPDLVCPSVCQSVFSPPVSPALHTHIQYAHTPSQHQTDTHKHNTPSNTHTHQDTHLKHALVCVTRAICLLTRAVFYTFTFVFPLMPLTQVCHSTAVVHFVYDDCMICKIMIQSFYQSISVFLAVKRKWRAEITTGRGGVKTMS